VLIVGRGKNRKAYPCDCGDGFVVVEKTTRKQGIGQKIRRMLTDLAKKPEMDVWERWCNWEDAVVPLIESIGPMPLNSIEHAPKDQVIDYACADAHNTWRIYPILMVRFLNMRRSVQCSM